MKVLKELAELAKSFSGSILVDWKKQGKPILGYMCQYIPIEIPHAGGILPYRISAKGCEGTTMADTVMASNTCSFARCCLELALRGEYGFLDGLVAANTCDTMRRMIDNWRHKVGTQFFHFVSIPYKSDKDAIVWFKQELLMFKNSLEQFFGVTITNEQLQNSVRICNETRNLLKRLYDLRKGENPPISGVEAQDIAIISNFMPKEEYNKFLKRIVDEIGGRKGIENYKSRIMTIGSLDDTAYTQIVEELGGLVVIDVSCFSTLSLWEPIRLTEQPLDEIARAYLNRVSCPRMPGQEWKRFDYIKNMIAAFSVDGIIFERIIYCNIWAGEMLAFKEDLQGLNIPLLILDREYIPSGLGQLRTRVQAFLEMIKGRETK
jgi:bzd-type benzoyl-CoA reductase N subunit